MRRRKKKQKRQQKKWEKKNLALFFQPGQKISAQPGEVVAMIWESGKIRFDGNAEINFFFFFKKTVKIATELDKKVQHSQD